MKIKVLYFSSLKDRIGKSSEDIEINGNSLEELKDKITQLHPEISDYLSKIMFAINEEYVSTDVILKEGDVVALIPPVSGG
ncbi:MAG: molybdopterin converting factor subunit 1 [Hydrogenothermaceae bacterium]|nr:molybdopterin converting factor subunit 1 [Hydrogenothermaceae bacterium]